MVMQIQAKANKIINSFIESTRIVFSSPNRSVLMQTQCRYEELLWSIWGDGPA